MKHPNILIIISDQQSIDTLSALKSLYTHEAYGVHWLKTPHLDRMLEKGMFFNQSHSVNPVCSPSRGTIFTGRMPIETGLVYNNIGIDDHIPNMGQWLEKNTDYECWYCGKWHAGGKWNYPQLNGARKIPGFNTLPASSLGTGDVADYQVAAASAAFVYNHKKKNPFLLTVGLMNPHDICFWGNNVNVARDNHFHIPEKDWPIPPPNQKSSFEEPFELKRKNFSEASWRNYRYDYYRMIEKLDADVGKIINAVDSRDDETIVIFTSDHGDGNGRHSMTGKWFPYDEVLKVPLMVYASGNIRTGIDNEHLVCNADIMPTVCDYAGIEPPEHQRGYSLRPLLEGNGIIGWRNHIYAEFMRTGRIIRTASHKFVKFYEPSGLPETSDKHFVLKETDKPSAFIAGSGHLFKNKFPRLLFDMEKDPWETQNLALYPEYQNIVTQHEKLLEGWEEKLLPGNHYDRN